MAHARGSFRRGRSVSPARRQSSWALGPGSSTVTQVSATTATLLGGGSQPTINGLTVVRIRGEFMATLASAQDIGDGFIGAFGIGDVSLPAFTAGIGSVPTPIAEADDDNWLYHRFFAVLATSSAGETWANGVSNSLRIEVDSKAMRKQGLDRILYAAVEVAEIGTAAVIDFTFDSRVLDKLP